MYVEHTVRVAFCIFLCHINSHVSILDSKIAFLKVLAHITSRIAARGCAQFFIAEQKSTVLHPHYECITTPDDQYYQFLMKYNASIIIYDHICYL